MDLNRSNDNPPGGVLIPSEPAPWFRQRHYLLDRGRTVIGRAPDCQVQISHPSVSRYHLALEWTEGGLVATCLSASNVTIINGVPMTGSQVLRGADSFEIGEGVSFRVELFDNVEDAPTVRPVGEHRLLAVVHADVVSYSRLVEEDAEATVRQFETYLEIIKREVAAMGGRIDNVAGDAVLIVFKSVLSAVVSTLNWQKKIAQSNQTLAPRRGIQFRAAVNCGDVLISPMNALYGDVINIAARIQSLTPPGEVFVASPVHEQLQGHEKLVFNYVGSEELKNITREIQVYSVRTRI